MKMLVTLASAGMLVSAVALAQNAQHEQPAQTESNQTTSDQASTNWGSTDQASTDANSASHVKSVRQDLKRDLQKAGFTDLHVTPGSFVVQGKDRSGHPVAMIINPTSMTEIVDEGSLASNNGEQTAQGAEFTTVPENGKLSSKLIGTTVYNDQNKDIGTIKDIAFGRTGVKAYIVGVGGFLGMGDHDVAVRPSAMQINYDQNDKTWKASLNATADQLKAAPEYKNPSEG
ncbi:MAG TPA: PRC-barrel domain-containing protein [Acetobacteraceae bacterium]|nr:PRC-barrel domain-containing protein [Acetobacteraceae bacterium]